ncbi:peptidoglycan editing factor PgeF [Methylobacterium isbiliense]|uniref:Purine nucleoside phosphorylase n=1 Tax=Methylobacterium isbiliense TaxID=315478 RepID=A0ABQ4SN06_9HYPH|nr:peptidoglycan editing factor PgeF [Methylobacterium isbiliense]MDN3622957.1 peptidoglycan editing factor PgeF [Methylobacterium isbiliense]GJE04616.1 Polyphenol oxidase [Methylobacterium isbiliense]
MLIEAPALGALPGLRHAFFTREGGVSEGLYASLNGGLGSGDDPARVAENRRRMTARLGLAPDALASLYQVHSAEALVVEAPFAERPKADGMATRVPGLALGILTADCGPILFADPANRVVGAAHAGWKGALTGVIEATLEAMEGLGAERGRITAVIGPTIGAAAYEVGPEFRQRFEEAAADNARYFAPSRERPGHSLFDLPAYIVARLERAGVGTVADLGLCTYSDPDRFFSYRRTTQRREADYGRLVAAIALAP